MPPNQRPRRRERPASDLETNTGAGRARAGGRRNDPPDSLPARGDRDNTAIQTDYEREIDRLDASIGGRID